jgi:hypothetical protein
MGGVYTEHQSVIEFKRLDVLKCRFTEAINCLSKINAHSNRTRSCIFFAAQFVLKIKT